MSGEDVSKSVEYVVKYLDKSVSNLRYISLLKLIQQK